MDLVGCVDGVPDGNYAISDKAALYCINRVNEEMVARLGTSVPPFFIESFMRYGDYECPDKYRIEITKCLREYSSEIYDIIQHFGNNKDRNRELLEENYIFVPELRIDIHIGIWESWNEELQELFITLQG